MIYYISGQKRIDNSDILTCTIQDVLKYFKDKEIIEVDSETEFNKRNPKHLPNPYENKVLCLQLGDKYNQYVIDNNTIDITPLKILFEDESKVKVFCNAFFDIRFILHWNFNIKNVYDVFLAECIIYKGLELPKGFRSLEQMSQRYLGVTLNKTIRGQIHWRGLDDTVIRYAAEDVAHMNDIRLKQIEILEKKKELTYLRFENKYCIALAKMSYKGFKVDPIKWLKVKELNEIKISKLIQELDNTINKLFPQVSLFAELTTINWNSSKQVLELWKKLGIDTTKRDKKSGEDKDSVDIKHLKRQANKFSILPIYIDYKETQKELSTYGEKFIKENLNPISKKIHSEYFQILDTSRISSNNPNLQNIPGVDNLGKVHPLRKCFIPSEGHKLIIADYCIDPNTLILKSNYKWSKIKDLKVGEELIGFDEYSRKDNYRKYQKSTVVSIANKFLPSYKITLKSGKTFICSSRHKWLINPKSSLAKKWIYTEDLKIGQSLNKSINTWDEPNLETAWLGGILDGEGTVSGGSYHNNNITRKGSFLSISQREGKVLKKCEEILNKNEIPYTKYEKKSEYSKTKVPAINIIGIKNCLKLLGLCPTERIFAKSNIIWENRVIRTNQDEIVSIENVGYQSLISLETTSKTYIADGYLSHNCQQEPRLMAEYSKDPYLIDFILNGDGDSHSLISTMISEYLLGKHMIVNKKNNPIVSKYNKKIRDIGKMINLGKDYGKTAFSIKDDLECTQEEAQTLLDIIDAKTPKKTLYFKKWKSFVEQNGYILSCDKLRCITYFYGYEEYKKLRAIPYDMKSKEQVKRFYKLKGEMDRFAQNNRIQNSGAIMTKLAHIYFNDILEEKNLQDFAWVVNCVHDEIIVDCKEEYTKEISNILSDCMVKAGKALCTTIPMIADPVIAECWEKE